MADGSRTLPIIGYDNYTVSEDGVVTNTKTGRVLKPIVASTGYCKVDLYCNGVGKIHSVHRLVAEAFLPNPDNKPCVNHKDSDRRKNSVENLEWATHQENIEHGWDVGFKTNIQLFVPVCQYSMDGILVNEYESITQAGIAMGKPGRRSGISNVLQGKSKSAYGFKWTYKERE